MRGNAAHVPIRNTRMDAIDINPKSTRDRADGEQTAAQRSLVPLAPAASRGTKNAPPAAAPFLAQLIAMKDGHPQARLRRRIAPSEATAVYRATARLAHR